MKMTIYTYRCVNGACRHIEKESGFNRPQIICPKCGSKMNKIKTEKE